jgi:hypothetical protein
MRDQEETIDTDKSVIDILGSIFDSGYQVLRIIKRSFTSYDAMVDQGIKDASMGAAGNTIKVFLGAIIIVMIILGVIIAAIAKWEL